MHENLVSAWELTDKGHARGAVVKRGGVMDYVILTLFALAGGPSAPGRKG
jgi:hypothetical protein